MAKPKASARGAKAGVPEGPLYDAMVVGAGPAGLSAALQLARFNRRVVVFDSGQGRSSGHQVNHNYLGFPGGLKAQELRELGRKQVREYPVAFVDEPVVKAEREGKNFRLASKGGGTYEGRTVVLATGVADNFPEFPDWPDYVGRSLFWCIVCDGYATRGKRLVVVGNDDEGAVTTLQLTEFTQRITLVTNGAECGISDEIMTALGDRDIPVITGHIAEVHGHDGIIGTVVLGDGTRLETDFLWNLQGQSPNTDLARQLGVKCDADGYILADYEQHTNVRGVFAAGDVTKELAHQIATAVHEGNTAATTANYFLYPPALRHETYEKAAK